jgi:hypothetical protein
MAVNFAERRKRAEAEGLAPASDRLKLKEGQNRFRLLTECLPHASTYQGQKTFKWLCYVVDRADGRVKPFFMPHKIYKQIEALQISEDYAFEDVPMPYDLTVTAEGAGTMQVKYSLIPARKETKVTQREFADLEKQKPLKELQASLLSKSTADQQQTHRRAPEPSATDDDDTSAEGEHGAPLSDDDIPF